MGMLVSTRMGHARRTADVFAFFNWKTHGDHRTASNCKRDLKTFGRVACLIAGAFLFTGGAAAQSPAPKSSFDHFVYVVPDLDKANEQMFASLGVRPSAGGVHPGVGTRNHLLSLGENSYLEILGPDPMASQSSPAVSAIKALRAPDIVIYAVAHKDLKEVSEIAARLGLGASPVMPGTRKTPTGEALQWDTVMIKAEGYAGLMPFFIDWKKSPHPGDTSAKGAQLTDVFVTHPNPEGLMKIYKAFDIRIPVLYGNKPGIFASITAGDQQIFISGSGKGFVK